MSTEGRSLTQDAWIRIRRDKIAMICLAIIVLYTVVALLTELGILFPDWNESVGERYEMENLPPLTTVYVVLIDEQEIDELPEEFSPHFLEENGWSYAYRYLPGRAAAAKHFFGKLDVEIPDDTARAAVADLREQWDRLSVSLRQWVLALPAERRDAIVAAGPELWRRLRVGGLPSSAAARDVNGGAAAYYEEQGFDLDRSQRDELSEDGLEAWRRFDQMARGWIQLQRESDRLICGGPPLWQGVRAAGIDTGERSSVVGGFSSSGSTAVELPANAPELWRQALATALASRRNELVSYLATRSPERRAQLLAGGVHALAGLSVEDVALSDAQLQAAGYRAAHTYLCGSDKAGRDVLQLVVQGSNISMKVGLLASLIAIPIGLILGAVAGYFGGWIDDLIVWFYTVLACVPGLLLILAIAWAIGGGLQAIYIALGATTWVQLCRLIRGEFLKLREQDYVLAATALGAGSWRIISKHMIPNAMHLVIITFSLRFVYAILSEVVLSYIGIGVNVSQPSWGRLISETQNELAGEGHWWVFTFTSLAMFFIVLAFNVFGDALRDALDPKLKR